MAFVPGFPVSLGVEGDRLGALFPGGEGGGPLIHPPEGGGGARVGELVAEVGRGGGGGAGGGAP